MIERRAALAAELRADVERRELAGYAAVFDQDAKIGHFVERVAPGCFRSTLGSGADVCCLIDHNPEALIGRTRSGTLTLAEDAKGLAFRVSLPQTTLANDLLEQVKRGDVGGASFGFEIERDEWPAPDRRILRSVKLAEISIVRSWPAYSGTSVQARGRFIAPYNKSLSPAARRRLVQSL